MDNIVLLDQTFTKKVGPFEVKHTERRVVSINTMCVSVNGDLHLAASVNERGEVYGSYPVDPGSIEIIRYLRCR